MKKYLNIEEFASAHNHQFALAYGCFDILHIGRIKFLQEIQRQSALPICIGILPDFVVSAMKGKNRPINNEEERFEVISAIKYIDFAFVTKQSNHINSLQQEYSLTQEELPIWSTALCWLDILRPQEFYYSSDFHMTTKIEKFFTDRNIKTIILPYTNGVSTSKIIEKYQR